LAQRARIVLLAADGVSNVAISERLGVSKPTVTSWRDRYRDGGMAALDDRPRSGRPRTLDHREIVAATLKSPPAKLGVTHWSSRPLARHLKIGDATVARAWREYGIQPWPSKTFKFSTDPELVAKVTDVVGLYLAPPENAVVLCIDEQSQIQALDPTAPMLPMQPNMPARRTHDYPGTTTLFAALEIATGRVPGHCLARHRHQEFLRFLRQITRAYPAVELHLVMDNYAAHKHPVARAWLAANPRVKVHFTPTSASCSTSSSAGSRSSSARPSTAVATPRCPTSTTASAPSSTAGTNAPTRSPGPRPPTRSSPKPTARRHQTRPTRSIAGGTRRRDTTSPAVTRQAQQPLSA
jgi:transposase